MNQCSLPAERSSDPSVFVRSYEPEQGRRRWSSGSWLDVPNQRVATRRARITLILMEPPADMVNVQKEFRRVRSLLAGEEIRLAELKRCMEERLRLAMENLVQVRRQCLTADRCFASPISQAASNILLIMPSSSDSTAVGEYLSVRPGSARIV
jgi:hypothetical protein